MVRVPLFINSSPIVTAKYGEIAIALQNKMEDNEHAAHLWHLTYGVLFTQTKRLSDCVKPLRAGFDSGLKQVSCSKVCSDEAAQSLSTSNPFIHLGKSYPRHVMWASCWLGGILFRHEAH